MSVPLDHYRRHADCGVYLHCRSCRLFSHFALEEIIARLDRRGIQGERVGISDVADYVTRPCRRCGERQFETGPSWDYGRPEHSPTPPYGGF